MIIDIANLSHENFRKMYRKVNKGTRIKATRDKIWIKQHGTNHADLAKLNYFELPNDWQNERCSGAKVALVTLLKWIKAGKPLDERFIEYASNIIHEDWLVRNFSRAKNEHRLSYKQLSENAKEKDRIFARAAAEIFRRNKQ